MADDVHAESPYYSRHTLQSIGLRALEPDEIQRWHTSQGRRLALEAQDAMIAAALEKSGISSRRDKHHDQVIVGLITGEVRHLPAWRHIHLLPSVAHADRQKLLRSMEWFGLHFGTKSPLRYGVITGGKRVPLDAGPLALRARFQDLHRTVSKWASASVLFGIEVLLRVTETTTAEDGSQHPHANVVYRPLRRLSRESWEKWLRWSHDFLGSAWRDCGKVASLAEVIKYVCKPADLLACESSDQVIGNLYHATLRLHLVQPMGSFRAMVRDHREARLSVKAVIGRDRVRRLVLAQGAEADPRPVPADPTARRENLIIGKPSLPSPALLPLAEPFIIVLGHTSSPATGCGVHGLARLRALQSEARERWASVGLGDYREAVNHASLMAVNSSITFKISIEKKDGQHANHS
jgi:hypothetical protein